MQTPTAIFAGCVHQEKHDVCSFLPWRQPDQGRSWTHGTRSLSVAESARRARRLILGKMLRSVF